jgi:hypothetical protein
MEVNDAGDDDLEENTTNQWGKFWLIWMSLLAVCRGSGDLPIPESAEVKSLVLGLCFLTS